MATSSNSSTPLPGEHGFHMRDGSLLKKKREQWEREKEEGKRQWFPFGARTSPRNNSNKVTTATNNNMTSPLANPPAQKSNSGNTTTTNNNNHPPAEAPPPPPTWPSPQYMTPYPVPTQPQLYNGPTPPSYLPHPNGQYPLPMQMYPSSQHLGLVNNGNPAYFTPINYGNGNYNPPYLDPNFTQNPHFNGINEKMEIVETRYETVQRAGPQNNGHFGQSPCPYESSTYASMSNGGESSAFTSFDGQAAGQSGWNRRHVQFGLDAATSDGGTGEARSHSKGSSEQEITEQIAERQRLEALREERERSELRQVQKDHIEQLTKQQQEAEEENSKWKRRQEIIEANQKAAIAQLEKAKKEAEILRKAKLHKHILLSEDVDEDRKREEIQKVLGIEDPELCERVKKQLKAMDRQKRIDMEKLNTSVHPSPVPAHHTPSGSSSRENTPLMTISQANSSPISSRLERSNTTNSIRSPLARRAEDAAAADKQCSPLPAGQTSTPLRRDNMGRASLRIPPTKKASPAGTALQQSSPNCTAAATATPSAADPIRRRSGSMERLTNKPAFVRASPARQTTTHYSPSTAKSSPLKVSTSTSLVKSKHLPPPVPPPRRLHKPAAGQQPMAESSDQEAGISNRHWSQTYITPSQPSQIPIPPPRSGQDHHHRGYDHTLQLLSDLPDVGESPVKSNLLRRSNFDSQLKPAIGLFEPVCTRTRQTKTMTQTPQNTLDALSASRQREQNSAGASSVATESESPESSSPISTSPPLSAGYKSRSPYEHNPQSTNEGSLSPEITSSNNRKYSEVEHILMNHNNKSGMQSPGNEHSHSKPMMITPSSSKDSMSEGNGMKPPRASPFARRLAQSGGVSKKMSAGEYLAPEMLRRNLRSPTMMRLQDSLGNLNVVGAGENQTSESLSRPTTPSKPFNCRTTHNYRSLNLKKDTERQHRILEQLAKVRAQLKDRQEKIERSFSNQNLANTT